MVTGIYYCYSTGEILVTAIYYCYSTGEMVNFFDVMTVVLLYRFGGGLVIVHASSKIKGRGRELQLPSIQQLTSKSSSQHFLLRILKVIIQLRQAAAAKAHAAGKQLWTYHSNYSTIK